MTTKQKELYNMIIALPEEVIVKDEDDLVCKLEKGIQASESGDVYSVDEVFHDT